MTTVQTDLPDQLAQQAQALVRNGWAPDLNALVAEALRRYLESHTDALAENFIREDVKWGLHGRD